MHVILISVNKSEFTNNASQKKKMLQYDPARRITAQTALEHDFFADMRRIPGPPPS